MKQQKVCVVGLGYIGLPTALLIAKSGVTTIGFDVDTQKISKLTKGELYFEEKGLQELFKAAQAKKSIEFTTTIKPADVFIIAVPTPHTMLAEGLGASADLTYVLSALNLIKSVFVDGNLIIIESTVGPKDCEDILIPEVTSWGKKFLFSHCPERAIPGNTLSEMVGNDRIIGAVDAQSATATQTVYAKFVTGNLYQTTVTVAASCKVMENTYRAVNIALANEFAKLGEQLGFNVWEAIELANKHPRVSIHQPGPGVGGHCIPIDPWFFVRKNTAPLIKLALEINEDMSDHVCQTVQAALTKQNVPKPVIAILGYAYKKNVDDTRETPAAALITKLSKFAKIIITDPYVSDARFSTLEEALTTADALVLVTDHDEYTSLHFKNYPNLKVIYDSRNCFTKEALEGATALVYKLGTPVLYD